jgi:hypothetical protein
MVLMSLSMFDLASQLMVSNILENYNKKDLKTQVFLRLYRDDFKPDETEKILKLINSR